MCGVVPTLTLSDGVVHLCYGMSERVWTERVEQLTAGETKENADADRR